MSPETDTHIVESAQAAGVFAAAAVRPKVGVPLLMLLNSRSARKRVDLIVFRRRFSRSFALWKGVVCKKERTWWQGKSEGWPTSQATSRAC